MKVSYASQYELSCIVVDPSDDPDEVIKMAQLEGAIYYDGEDDCLVLDIPEKGRWVGPELYTEQSFRRSMRQPARSNRGGK